MDLIARRVIEKFENGNVTEGILSEYADSETELYKAMLAEICKELNFSTLQFACLDDMLDATGLDQCKLSAYCWNGKK